MINVTVAYYISSETKARIEQEAKALDRSASWLVDKILGDWVAAQDQQPPAPQVAGRKKTGPLGEKR